MRPFPPSFGNLYILLAVDYVSKWVKAIDCPRNGANIVVGFIQRNILNRYAAPRTIIGDEESILQTIFLQKLLSIYGVKHVMGLAYHPQSNGQA